MKQALRDNLEFLKQFRHQFHTTGAILPSSRFLAKAVTRPLRALASPKRVLEVGPGTGAVTKQIVKYIGPEDRFDLVEINQEFAGLLRERFQTDPCYLSAADRSRVHVCPMQEFQADAPYDVIISGLPFNNFNSQLVEELVDASLNLLAPGGTFSFFEYMYVRKVRGSIGRGQERKRMREVDSVLQNRFERHRIRRDWIFVNVPPAWVQHLRRDVEASA